jgi:hypothetical protein
MSDYFRIVQSSRHSRGRPHPARESALPGSQPCPGAMRAGSQEAWRASAIRRHARVRCRCTVHLSKCLMRTAQPTRIQARVRRVRPLESETESEP